MVLVGILLCGFVNAQEKNKGQWSDKIFGKNLRFIGNPILQNSPETGIKFGLAGNYFFKPGKDSLTRSSNIYLQIAFTTKQQFILEPIWNVFTPSENFILRGRAGYLNFTDHFWGIGPLTEVSSKVNLSYRRVYFQSKVLRKLKGNWFAGAQIRYSAIYGLRWTNTNTPNVEGSDGYTVWGIGPNVQADFRDNPFSPQKGWYADLYYARFGSWVGGTHTFDEIQADLRYYLPLRKPFQVLALQAFGNFTQGMVPFRELPRLGSAFLMRGYFEGRFRDNNYVATQIEWRQPVYKWIHASAFLALGEVSPNLKLLNLQRLKSTAGMGIRILINKKELVFVRFDVAVNNEGGTGIYIRINDAF